MTYESVLLTFIKFNHLGAQNGCLLHLCKVLVRSEMNQMPEHVYHLSRQTWGGAELVETPHTHTHIGIIVRGNGMVGRRTNQQTILYTEPRGDGKCEV